jgi:AsmA family/AsmA-like C-terminal region
MGWLRWVLSVVAVLLVLVVGTLALLPQLLDTPTMQGYIAQTASHAVGRPVKFTSVSVSLLPLPHVNLKGLEVADDPRFGTTPLVRVGEVRVGVRVKPLLSLRIEVGSITLQDAQVELVERGGRWNFAALSAAPAPAKPATRTVPGIPGSAAMGSVLVSRVGLKNAVVNVRRPDVKNGDLRIEGLDATVSGVGGSELGLEGAARLEPGDLRLRNVQASVGMRGAGETPIKASVEIDGSDIGPLARSFLPSPALSGPIKGKIQLSGTPSRLAGTGAVDLTHLTMTEDRSGCPPPVRRQLVLDQVHVPVLLKPASFESFPMSAKLGTGSIGFNLVVALDASSRITLADIKITGVQLQPVLQNYLCQGFAVTGPLDLIGEMSMRSADLLRTMNGLGQFKVGAGRVVGEGALKIVRDVLAAGNIFDMALRGKLAGPSKTALDFDSITGSYKIINGVARTDDVVYQSKDLKVTVAGSYALADGRTDMKVIATQGSNQLRAQVTGRGGSLRVVPTRVDVKEPAEVKKLLDRLLR